MTTTRVAARLRLSLLAVLLHAAIAPMAAGQEVQFRRPLSSPVGDTPFDLVIADLNGDDHLDIVSANFGAGSITVLLGTGTGDFIVLDDIPASTAPLKLALGFLDGDEHLDLIVSEGESDFLYLLRGNGDGTFGADEPIGSGHDPYALAIADMNADGRPDVVQTLAAETGGRVNVLLGDGEGGFALSEENGRRVNGPSYGVVIGDFNEDGHLDAAATALGRTNPCNLVPTCGTLAVMLGNGTGQLARSMDYATGQAPFAIASADLDKDGHLDIITVDSGDNHLSVFEGDGQGGFVRAARYQTGVRPASITLVDFDGDGWLEAVVGNALGGDISVFPGLVGGGFGTPRHFVSGLTLFVAGAADLDNDGRLDLVGLNQGDLDPTASVLLGRVDGGFDAAQTIRPTAESNSVAAGATRPGSPPELVLGTTTDTLADVFEPLGTQQFALLQSLETPFRPGSIALRDVNGDGRADFLAAANGSPNLIVSLAAEDGEFGPPELLAITGIASSLVVADLDGDGRLDLAAPSASPPAVSVLHGIGDGTFDAAASVELGGAPLNIASGDFNGDGVADLAVGNAQQNAVTLVLGSAERTLETASVDVAATPTLLACADLDADGFDDLIVSAGVNASLRVLYGSGDTTFTPGNQISVARPPAGIAARDVTGDLRPDLLVTRQGGTDLGIVANRGGRAFAPVEDFFLGIRPGAISVADFDADGRYDVAVSGVGGWVLTNDGPRDPGFLRGDGNGDGALSVADVVALRRAGRATRVEDLLAFGDGTTAAADVNGDGFLDGSDTLLSIRSLFDP